MVVLTLSELVVHILYLLILHEESLRTHVVVFLLSFRWADSRDSSCVLCRLWSHVISRCPVSLVRSQTINVGLLELSNRLCGVETSIAHSITHQNESFI